MNSKKERIAQVSNVLSKITSVAMGFVIAAVIALLGLAVLVQAGNINLNMIKLTPSLEANIFLDGITPISLADISIPLAFAGFCILLVIDFVILYLLLKNLKAIFKDLAQEESPFSQLQVKRLKSVTHQSIGLGIMGVVVSLYIRSAFALPRFDYSINLTNLLFPVLIYFIAYIIEYGCELQQFSDETL